MAEMPSSAAVSSNPSVRPRRRKGRRVLRFLGIAFLLVIVVLVAAGLWLRGRVLGSLPQVEGELPLAGLAAPVSVERDGHGVPVIRGDSRLDVARATGFVHGQDRFFQMDLLRRSSAGELAELFGNAVVGVDRRVRLHRFRWRAGQALATLPAADREMLEAYTAGVNAGLGSLDASPFEYLLLRTEPVAWRPEDSLLVVYSMYLDLQGSDGPREASFALMEELLPAPLVNFLLAPGTPWDAPLVGEALEVPPIPGPEVVNPRTGTAAPVPEEEVPEELAPEEPALAAELAADAAVGSNNWALAGSRTADGRALLANDMHLGLSVPNIWYRASFVYPGADGAERRVTGVTLPGTPMVVAGSTERIAWGFTNSQGDWSDLVDLDIEGEIEAETYRTPDGPRPFERAVEVIRVKGGADVEVEVLSTIWGPVLEADSQGRRRAWRWVAHEAEALNFRVVDLEAATTVDEALAVAHGAAIPAQNFVVADADGRIAWTLIGRIPRRVGHDGRFPRSWADGEAGWDGWLSAEETPRVVDPESGQIWTANARVVSGEDLAKLGDGGYDLGARAGQIRDGLAALTAATEKDLLAVQLDDRALFLERWRQLLLEVLAAAGEEPLRAEARRLVEDWGGRASVDSAGYRLVRGFRLEVAERVLGFLVRPCDEADPNFSYFRHPQWEGPLWRLLTERPLHFLDPQYESWDAFLLTAVDSLLAQVTADGSPLAAQTWGRFNRSRIQHPVGRAVPRLGRWLNMPVLELPGDSNMPRVQTPGFGASERFVVSPGRQAEGIFHMPGGQSGHPLSPHYGDGHAAWAEGQPTPFLPGEAVTVLRLVPASPSG